MIAVIRISGMVNVRQEISETLDRMKLRRKYACVLVDENSPEKIGMIKKLRNFVAYGRINEETIVKLIKARGRMADKTEIKDEKGIAKEILSDKKLEEAGLKPFFRLHPPRRGIKSKLHYPKGVLGDNKEDINKLIERML